MVVQRTNFNSFTRKVESSLGSLQRVNRRWGEKQLSLTFSDRKVLRGSLTLRQSVIRVNVKAVTVYPRRINLWGKGGCRTSSHLVVFCGAASMMMYFVGARAAQSHGQVGVLPRDVIDYL